MMIPNYMPSFHPRSLQPLVNNSYQNVPRGKKGLVGMIKLQQRLQKGLPGKLGSPARKLCLRIRQRLQVIMYRPPRLGSELTDKL